MRHIIPPSPKKAHKPTPTFHNHSRVLAVIIFIAHPFISYVCLQIAKSALAIHKPFFKFLYSIYGEDSALSSYDFLGISESQTPYNLTLVLSLLLVAWSAGNFELFRFKNFWINFTISLSLLLIGLMLFAPQIFASVLNP